MNIFGAKVELSITHEDGAHEKITFWASTVTAKLDPKPEPMPLFFTSDFRIHPREFDFSMECTDLRDIHMEREAVPIPPQVTEAAQRTISRIFNDVEQP
jgi:hypothetical protein